MTRPVRLTLPNLTTGDLPTLHHTQYTLYTVHLLTTEHRLYSAKNTFSQKNVLIVMQGYTHIANILPLNDVNTIINVLNTPRTPKTDCLGNKFFL